MRTKAYLILENGAVFRGEYFGAKGRAAGEIVFTTGMVGYLETLTDPGYYGQFILQTFPLIGNYGVIKADLESGDVAAKAYIAKYPCQDPSNFRSEGDLDTFLRERGIIGLCGIDTRALTKIIRDNGVMNGYITDEAPTETERAAAAAYRITGPVAAVSGRSIIREGLGRRVALLDYGMKRGMAEALLVRGCEVWTFPHDTDAKTIIDSRPDGVLLSGGPGDPADPANKPLVGTISELDKAGLPIFGIGLGHQLLALGKGYGTKRLKFGHRGANQGVKDKKSGRIFITGQNHGYAVEAEDSAFVNVNDGTCEGLDYGRAFSVQFHPQGRGAPLDTGFLFDRFVERMDNATNERK